MGSAPSNGQVKAIGATMQPPQTRQRISQIYDPRSDVIRIRDPRTGHGQVGVVAFYYENCQEDPWDHLCQAAFLGNFFDVGEDGLTLQLNQDIRCYRNAEAAYQSLKNWKRAEEFRCLSGEEAFKKGRDMQFDKTYSGCGNSFQAMRNVLNAKFADCSALAQFLRKTGDAFLLEHNNAINRDNTWSDNNDGSGKNLLGVSLMLVRDDLCGQSAWTKYLKNIFDERNGDYHTAHSQGVWKETVVAAVTAMHAALPKCSHQGCGKPTWNAARNEYCCKAHRDLNVKLSNARPVSAGAARTPVSIPEASGGQLQLPLGWETTVDKQSGKMYYFNRTTGQTLWDPPNGSVRVGGSQPSARPESARAQRQREQQQPALARNVLESAEQDRLRREEARERELAQQRSIAAAARQPLATAVPDQRHIPAVQQNAQAQARVVQQSDDLPAGWKAVFEKSANRCYYWHVDSGQVTWSKPTAAIVN